MHTYKGIPCMTGIAVGEALVMPRDVEHHIHRRQVAPDEAAREDEKCRAALAKAAEEIDREIEQRALELDCIDPRGPETSRADHFDGNRWSHGAANEIFHAMNEPVDVGGLWIERLPA